MKKEAYVTATLAVVLAVTAAKAALYIMTGSLAVMAELLDSVLDIVVSAATLYAVRRSTEPPDREHPYGHGKFESLVAYTVAIFAAMAGAYLAWRLVERVVRGYTIRVTGEALLLAGALVLVDASLSLFNLYGYRRLGSLALKANYVNYLGDTVRGIGVFTALLAYSIGIRVADPLVTAALLSYFAYEAAGLLRESVRVLVDEAPPGIVETALSAALCVKGVSGIGRVRARCMGDRPYVDMVVYVPRGLSVEEAHRIADAVEHEVGEKLGGAEVVVHVEPADNSGK